MNIYPRRRTKATTRRMAKRRTNYAGKTVTSSTTFEMQFTNSPRPILGILNGKSLVQDVTTSVLVKELYVQPARIAGLLARQFVYNQYKILGVEYKLMRPDKTMVSTGPIQGRYSYADYACIMPNTHNEDFPDIQPGTPIDTTAKLMAWMLQQKGSKMIKIHQNFCRLRVPPMVNLVRTFQDASGTGTTTQMSTVRHPWMELVESKMTDMNLGQAIFAMPPLDISTFYPTFATAADQAPGSQPAGTPGATHSAIKDMYDYKIFATVKWAVRGKYIDPAAAVYKNAPEDKEEDDILEGEDTVDLGGLCEQMEKMKI